MIQPIRDGILVRPCKSDEKSVGGIIVPDSYKEISNKVEIVAVGNGIKDRPMAFKKGDIVGKIKGCGVDVLVNGELHLLIKDNWILTKYN